MSHASSSCANILSVYTLSGLRVAALKPSKRRRGRAADPLVCPSCLQGPATKLVRKPSPLPSISAGCGSRKPECLAHKCAIQRPSGLCEPWPLSSVEAMLAIVVVSEPRRHPVGPGYRQMGFF